MVLALAGDSTITNAPDPLFDFVAFFFAMLFGPHLNGVATKSSRELRPRNLA